MPSPAALVPHAQDALLLDEITSATERALQARLIVRRGTAFSDQSGNLPAWVGPEIMAQAIAALSGCRALRSHGRPGAIGLLLGVRSYVAVGREFRCGDSLQVEVIESSRDEDGRAVYDGSICRAGEVLASGTLTVFEPPDDSFLDVECTSHA
jgi:predicted hotdog family 3-hydroxylacyl-ACP dehydratase